LREVEVAQQVAELGDVLADGRALIRPPIGCRVEPLAAEEVVLDDFA
jgi:hypothetical protein